MRKQARFSGSELKFVRQFMGLTQKIIADTLGVERSAVAKWESNVLNAAGMPRATEFIIRIHMILKLRRSLDREFPLIEPAVRKKAVGDPIEVSVA